MKGSATWKKKGGTAARPRIEQSGQERSALLAAISR